jgi:microcystin degradation protein MlrC
MTRIAVGGFLHETNTFAPTKATYDAFVHGGGWPNGKPFAPATSAREAVR